MEIQRALKTQVLNRLKPNKVMLIIGARRVGKTVLINKIKNELSEEVLFLNGDDLDTLRLLEQRTLVNYQRLLGDCRFLIIDEAQEIPDIGMKLKLMIDNINGLKIIVTGSSAFELNNQIGEPLVGRMEVFQMFPIAQMEFSQSENYMDTFSKLEERLIFGSYPEVSLVNGKDDKIEYLKGIVNSYLLKDILAFEGIRRRDVIYKLLQKMAFRTGSEISLEGLGRELQISKNTVEKYLDLFKKTFIIYDMSGFSRNRDNEITKMKKWFFSDNGIRNALINNFNPLSSRDDKGILWENYLHSERKKHTHYKKLQTNSYFWRTHSQQEIDRIEETAGKISAYEFKFTKSKVKAPSQFVSAYPKAEFQVIHRENYLDFIV